MTTTTPEGFHRATPILLFKDVRKAIDFSKRFSSTA